MAHGPSKTTTHDHTEAQVADLAHDDTAAIHDDESAEISALTEKTPAHADDVVLLEDSAASNAKKKMTVANLGLGSTDVIHSFSNMGSTITANADPYTISQVSVTAAAGDLYVCDALVLAEVATANRWATFYFDIGEGWDPGHSFLDWHVAATDRYSAGWFSGAVAVNSTSDAHVHTHGVVCATDVLEDADVPWSLHGPVSHHYATDETGSTTIDFRVAVENTTDVKFRVMYFVVKKVTF